jgi:hypothetical protein
MSAPCWAEATRPSMSGMAPIRQRCVDLLVQFVDELRWGVLGHTDTNPCSRVVTRQELAQRWDIRQDLRTSRGALARPRHSIALSPISKVINDQNVRQIKADGRDHEQVHGCNLRQVVAQECAPALTRRAAVCAGLTLGDSLT